MGHDQRRDTITARRLKEPTLGSRRGCLLLIFPDNATGLMICHSAPNLVAGSPVCILNATMSRPILDDNIINLDIQRPAAVPLFYHKCEIRYCLKSRHPMASHIIM